MKQSNLKRAYEISERLKVIDGYLLLMDLTPLVCLSIEGLELVKVRNDPLKGLLLNEKDHLVQLIKSLGIKELDE